MRGKKEGLPKIKDVPCIIESDRSPAACRKSWAGLIQKTYEIDPLVCPKCRGTMRIISFIEDREIVKTILQQLRSGSSDQNPLLRPMPRLTVNAPRMGAATPPFPP